MALFRYSSNTLIHIEPKGNATRGDVTNGKTFSSEREGINATGILADWRSRTNDIDLSEIRSDGYVYLRPKGDARIDNTSLFRILQEKISTTLKIDEYFIKNYLSEPEILTTAPNDGIIVGIFSQNPGAAPGTSVCYVEVNGSRVLSDGASREDGIIMARTLGKYHNVKKGDVIKGYINRGQQNPVYIMIYAHPK